MNQDSSTFFRENGYAILRGAFTGERLETLQSHAKATRERAERESPPGVRYVNQTRLPDHSWGINEITRPGWFDPVLINAIAAPKLLGALTDLLEAPRAWGQKMLWAPKACDYDLHWHRDIQAKYGWLMPFKDDRNDHVQFNGALQEDDSFVVVPRSHRRVMNDEEARLLSDDKYTGPLPGEMRVHLHPGDVVMMDAHALHRGSANAGAPRLSLHFSFQANWVPLHPWGNEADFAWIQSDEFIQQLDPDIRPLYERVRSAERLDHAENHLEWLERLAKQST